MNPEQIKQLQREKAAREAAETEFFRAQRASGHEHFRRAEEFAARAEAERYSEGRQAFATLAQAHATMALAAATADATNFKRELYRGLGQEPPAAAARKRKAADAANDFI